jgi:hypothetical protein
LDFHNVAYPLDKFPLLEGDSRRAVEMPRELKLMLHLQGAQPADYKSRSELFWAFLNEARRRNLDVNTIVDACSDPALAAGSIYEHVAENGGAKYVQDQIAKALNEISTTTDGKPNIAVRASELHKVRRAAERALIAARCPVFVRGGRPVWPQWRWEKTDETDGRTLVCEIATYQLGPIGRYDRSPRRRLHPVRRAEGERRSNRPAPRGGGEPAPFGALGVQVAPGHSQLAHYAPGRFNIDGGGLRRSGAALVQI